jgi:DNA-binding MarR family transcriptional regulator
MSRTTFVGIPNSSSPTSAKRTSSIATDTGINLSHVSRALQQLREKELVELLVSESRRKGRVYGITDPGESVYERIRSHGLN